MMGENTGMPAFPAYVRKYEAQNQLWEGRGLVYLRISRENKEFHQKSFWVSVVGRYLEKGQPGE